MLHVLAQENNSLLISLLAGKFDAETGSIATASAAKSIALPVSGHHHLSR
jgi:hypothetical protein